MTGNASGSLGLHPAVYFYNERGKYSRFLFLGVTSLIVEKIRNNDSAFFKRFTTVRSRVEGFLIDNKSLITNILQNLSKNLRVVRIKSLFEYMINEFSDDREVTPEQAITHLGLRGLIFDVNAAQTSPQISDDTKSMIFEREAIKQALKCPLCNGLLDPKKSISYDHIVARRDGGSGDHSNVQMVHPYCNSIKP
jgi:HNH endonuclease